MSRTTSRAVGAAAASVLFLADISSYGQTQTRAGERSADHVWQVIDQPLAAVPQRPDIGGQSALVLLNKEAFDARLAQAPQEDEPSARGGVEMALPMPNGAFARFTVVESAMLAPELATAFPQIRTYRAQGIDDPTATARFGWTGLGFHAIVISASGTTYVDPHSKGHLDYYIAYRKQDRQFDGVPFVCLVDGSQGDELNRPLDAFPIAHGASLRTYRLALAATAEYTAAAGGTKTLALARMAASMNRVNAIYERELAVRMLLATGTPGDPTALIFTTNPDPYSNNDGIDMLGENQFVVDTVIGSANYDIGHVFSTGSGGVATLNSPCNASTKARGVTGLPNPVGDAFDVDFVAHEMGHQFGGRHTFNGTSFACAGNNRSAAHAYEVGSGSTIMAYAGVCSVEDLQPNSDDYFHVESLNEITAFVTSAAGTSCGAAVATGNAPPTISAPGDFTIPRNTPFTMSAHAVDSDGHALTYAWEQYDLGTASSSVATASTDHGNRPLFRSYPPQTMASRTFPSLQYVLNNANVPPATYACIGGSCLTGEVLPSLDRTMTFQLTARDNQSGGGGIATTMSTVTIESSAGPFRVTAPNTAVSYTSGSTQTITWDVNGTNVPPVNATNVKISLSTDGGLTFPTVLLASTPNDGSQSIVLPGSESSTARIKVEAVDNIFFDVSDTNFAIASGPAPGPPPPPSLLFLLFLPSVGPPTNFAASVSGNNVTFTWTPAVGILPITSYLLEGGVTPGQTLAGFPIPFATNSVAIPLPTGVFFVRLYALSDGTRSGASNEIQLFVNVPQPPSPPSNLLGLVNGSSLGLSWVNPVSGGTPTSIVIDVSGTLSGSLPLAPSIETFSVGGVPPGTYTFSVRAANATGSSASSPPVTLTFPGACSGAPLMPVNFVLSTIGRTLSLSWQPPASGPAATSYVLNVAGAFNGMVPMPVRSIAGSVGPGSYTISVAATNACGAGPATETQTVVVP